MATCEESSFAVDDPSDWPSYFRELRMLDSLLRCSICFEYFNVAVTPTGCWHNYCSLCARKHISYKPHCPSCHVEMRQSHLKSNRVLDEIVKVFVALRPKLLSVLKEYKDFKLKRKENELLGDKAEASSLQESKKSRKSARASKTAKPVRRQKVRCSEMKDDDDFQETKKRNDDERKERKRTDDEQNFAGSSTTSLSDIESHPAHHSEVEIYLEYSSEACSDSDATLLPDSYGSLQLPKKRPQDSDDSTDFAEPDFKRRKIGDEKRKKSTGSSEEDKTVLETENLVLPDVEARQLSDIEDDAVFQGVASNDLLPVTEDECRKKLPELVISGFREKQLRNKLQEYGLSSKGDKKALRNRLRSFWLLYNSQCDAVSPMPVSDIIKQVESTERMQKKLDKGHMVLQTFDRSKSDQEKQEFNEKYLIKHREHFNSLIKDVIGRRNRNQQLNTTNDDTVADSPRQSVDSATFARSPSSYVDDAVEEEVPQDGEEIGKKQIPSFDKLGRYSPTENRSLISEDDAHQLASKEADMHDYPDLQDTELCRTPQRRSCSTAVKSMSYRSPEFKALELLCKAVSTAIPVVEKLHATVCGTNLSPSNSISIEKSVSKVGEVGSNTRNGADASFSKEGSHNQNALLISPKASHTATGFTNVKGKKNVFVQQRRTACKMEPRDEANNSDSITILDSDEELANENERFEGGWRHSTPSHRESLSSTTSTSHLKSYSVGRQGRKASTSCMSDEGTKKDGDDSRRVGSEVKRNILTSSKNESMLEVNESASKKSDRKVKKRRCRSKRITSFFSKVEDKGKVKNEIEDTSSKFPASDRALFGTSSPSDSDLESSTVILDRLLSGRKSPCADDIDVEVSCTSGTSSQSRTLKTSQSTVKSKAQNVAQCTTQSISENTMQNANIHAELEEHDSDEEFLSKARHSPRKRRAVVESSSSEEDDSDIEIPARGRRSKKNVVESDSDFSPTTDSSDLIYSTAVESNASHDSEKSFVF